MVDVQAHSIATFVGDEVAGVAQHIASFDALAGVDVRRLLRALQVNPDAKRLGELGPPQKTLTIDGRGRTLKLTPEYLIGGSCGITRPFGDSKKLDAYLRDGHEGKLRRRLQASAKSLHAYFQYGRLQHAVRMRWGFLDERFQAPWVSSDEPGLYALMERALESGSPLEVVVGSAPGWADPWSRVQRAHVPKEDRGYGMVLVDDTGELINERDVQLAREPTTRR